MQQRWNRGPEKSPRYKFALILAACLAVVALASCEKNKAAPAPQGMGPLPVSVVRVQQADIPLTGEWVGTLDGFVNAQIQPQVSGYLIRQDYREGSYVSKGQVLFEIDPRPFQAAVDQAQGQLAQAQAQVGQAQGQVGQAQAQLELTRINVNRDTPLAAARAIAQSQLDNEKQQGAQAQAAVASAEASVNAAHASVVAAEAALTNAKLNLGFTQVRSLISGIAGQATTQVGNLVNPQSVLTSVSQLDPIKVYFSISDSEYLSLTARAREAGGDLLYASSVHGSPAIPLTLKLSDGQIYAHKGRIAFVDRQMNQQTGAIRIAAEFPNPGNILRPGQFGRVSAETEVRRGALLLPQIAVQELQGMEQVDTVGADNRVHVVNVKLGPQFGKDWIIESGLDPGTRVITDNLQKVRDGVPVSPREISADTSAPSAANQQAER
ncbi:MAG: efflux RND transporter periplasmic adaptor subunit [Acidobacteriaceae bacterium]|nr:efflux RND transporter periplasmic adaptor subunit [Acidobacteriaceae bacterium]